MDNFYITVSPWDHNDTLPTNTAYDFTSQLPTGTNLEGPWFCGLTDSYLEGLGIEYTHVKICTDIVEERFTGAERVPVLRETFLKEQRDFKSYSPVQYVTLNSGQLTKIRSYVTGRRASDLRECRLTLHFVPIGELKYFC